MTAVSSPHTPVAASPARLTRTAGIAALVAAVAYLVQPIIVFVINPETTGAGGYPVADDLLNVRGLVPLELAEFGTVGVATLVLVVALDRLRRSVGAESVLGTVGTLLGVVGAAGWLGAAALTLGVYGLLATNLGEITPDPTLQQAVIQGSLVGDGMLDLGLVGIAGWLAVLGTSGRRAGLVGWPLAIVALVVAAGMLLPALILLVPFGGLLIIPGFLALGIGLLVRSRAR
jgi:hypothetical protein